MSSNDKIAVYGNRTNVVHVPEIISYKHLIYLFVIVASVVSAGFLLLPGPYNLLPIIMIPGAVFVVAAIRYPFVGLFLYLFIFFFRPYELFPVPVHYEKIVALILLAILAVHIALKRHEIKLSRLDMVVMAFVTAALASVPGFTYLCDVTMAWNAFFEFFKTFLVFFLIIQIARSKTNLEAIVWLFILSNLYIALSSSIDYYFGTAHYSMGIQRARGVAEDGLNSHPNAVANSLVLGLPFLYYFIKNYRNIILRVFIVLIIIASIWTVILTGSRGGQLSMLVFLLVIGWYSRHRLIGVLGAVIFSITIFFAMPEQYKERIETLTNIDVEDGMVADESASGRIEGFIAGMKLFSMRPLTGVGIGNFPRAHYETGGVYSNAHNLPGELLGELGLIGLVTFVAFVYMFAKTLKYILHKYKDREWPKDFLFYNAMAIRTSLVLLFVQGVSGHNVYRFNWYIFAAFTSIMFFLVKERLAAESQSDQSMRVLAEQ